nr:MAG TPA_asm: hypothetical protein [Caudoviricetes sp.]
MYRAELYDKSDFCGNKGAPPRPDGFAPVPVFMTKQGLFYGFLSSGLTILPYV